MKNGKDFRKINNGLYGAINFNNMIPVLDSALIEIDIANIADVKYRRLLQNQYNSIKADEKGILKTAENLRKLIFDAETNLSAHDKVIKQRCCDLVLLEEFLSLVTQQTQHVSSTLLQVQLLTALLILSDVCTQMHSSQVLHQYQLT